METKKDKKDQAGIRRRDFLKGSAVGITAIGGGSMLAACDLKDSEPTIGSVSEPLHSKKKGNRRADVVILGYGGSGMVAAIEAAKSGASVLALEKSPFSGGCTKISDTFITAPKSVEGMVQYLKATIGQNNVSDAIIQAISEETYQNTEWLHSMGIDFEPNEAYEAEFPAAPGQPDMIAGKPSGSNSPNPPTPGAHGAILCDALAEQAEARGVRVLYNTTAKELIQHSKTKEIIGVIAEQDGKEIIVKAKKAVILCTGGFDFNEEMIRNYLRPYPLKFAGWRYNTGDGIPMSTMVGAKLWHMNGVCGYYCPWFEEGKSGYIFFGASNPSWMYCDKNGKRFANESRMMEHNFWKNMIELDETGLGYARNPGWVVFDETARQAGPLATSFTAWLPEEMGAAPEFSEDNSVELAKGWIIKGDTVEELESKTGMSAESLQAEIDHINQAVANGTPDKFGRTTEGHFGAMGSWDNGPYYAMPVYAGGISTMGGPERNEKGQIIGCDGKPIPRLYGAGTLGSIYGDHYGPFGGNVGISVLAGGRIAGRHAAAEKS